MYINSTHQKCRIEHFLHPVAMSGWYLCTNLSGAVDAYDLLGVWPGPGDIKHTRLTRIMTLSALPDSAIQECYERTMNAVGKESREAEHIDSAYNSLQRGVRREYDAKLLADASVVTR